MIYLKLKKVSDKFSLKNKMKRCIVIKAKVKTELFIQKLLIQGRIYTGGFSV